MKNITFLLIFITSITFSQSISTKFIRSGYLTNKPNVISTSTCEFKNKKVVEVIEYVKNDWWKVKFKNCIGYVTSPFISINEELIKRKENKLLKISNEREKIQDSIIRANDSILKIKKSLKIQERKRIDSIKVIIKKYAADSLLIASARKGSKLKIKPSIFGDIITTLNNDKKVVILDYLDDYFKVCINSSCGFMSEIYFSSSISSFRTDNKLLDEFRKVKKAKIKEQIRKEKLKELEKEKDIYFNQCMYNSKEKDEFTGLTRKNTIFYNIHEYNSEEIEIQLKRYGSTKYIRIKSQRDLGCTSPYSTSKSNVKFKLENGDIVTFYHSDDIDCGKFDLLGKLTSNDIIRLKKSPIKTIRLSGTEYYHDIKDLFFKDFFIKKLDCIK